MTEADQSRHEERVEVTAALDGERVDRALATITGRSRAEVAARIARGQVSVNGVVVQVRHQRVIAGDTLVFVGDDAKPGDGLQPDPSADIVFRVVYEDEDIIVVDKPAGLVVHPGAGHLHDTLASGLIARYPDLIEAAREGAGDPSRPGLVHRLDKDTSGLLVVARTPEAYRSLVAQLQDRSMGREYEALALGSFDNDEGTIEAPIGRSSRAPTKMAVHAGGRDARTHYRVLEQFALPIPTTLLGLRLETGRTHQIRVHLGAIGHPVVGDARYGGTARDLPLDRPFLHASRLRLIHPATGEEMEWTSSRPDDLERMLSQLRDQQSP